MEIKAILFDMDGVLVDSEMYYMEGTLKWMQELGFKGTFKDVCSFIGTTNTVTCQMASKMLDDKYTPEELFEINHRYFKVDHPIQYNQVMNEGVVELLDEIKKRGWKCAVCSSSPKSMIDRALAECGIEQYFDFIVSGEQFVLSKPNPEIYLHAADKLNVLPDECLVIEDSEKGIAAGKNAQMKTIALLDRRFSLKQANADVLVERLSEILECIKYL